MVRFSLPVVLLQLPIILMLAPVAACGGDEADKQGAATKNASPADAGGTTADVAAGRPPARLFEAAVARGRDLAPGCYAELDLAALVPGDSLDCAAAAGRPHVVVEQGLDDGEPWLRVSRVEPAPGDVDGAPAMDVTRWSVTLDLTSGAVTAWENTQTDAQGRPVGQVRFQTGPVEHLTAATFDPESGRRLGFLHMTRDASPGAPQPFNYTRIRGEAPPLTISRERDEDGIVFERLGLTGAVTGQWYRVEDPEHNMDINQQGGPCDALRDDAEAHVRRLTMALFTDLARGNPPPLHLAPFPAKQSCCADHGGPDADGDGLCDAGAYETAPAGWQHLGFDIATAGPLIFSLGVSPEGRFEVRAVADRDCDGNAEFVVAGSFGLDEAGRPDAGTRSLAVSPAAVACAEAVKLPLDTQEVALDVAGNPPADSRLRVDGRPVGARLPDKVALRPGGHLLEVVGPAFYAARTVLVGAAGPRQVRLEPGCELPAAGDRCAMPSALFARRERIRGLADLTLFVPPEGTPAAESSPRKLVAPPPKTESPPPRQELPPTIPAALFPAGLPTADGLQLGRPCAAADAAGRVLAARLTAAWAGRGLAAVAADHAGELGLEPGDLEEAPAAPPAAADWLEATQRTFADGLTADHLEKLAGLLEKHPGLAAYLAAKGEFLCRSLPLLAANDYAGFSRLMEECATRAGVTRAAWLEMDAEWSTDRLVQAEAAARAVCCLVDEGGAGQGGAQ